MLFSTKNIEKIVKNDIIILNCFKKLKQIEEINDLEDEINDIEDDLNVIIDDLKD